MNFIDLPEKAKQKALVVQQVLENGSSLNSRRRACIRLGVCEKTLARYIKGCKENHYEVFVHGNKGKKPATLISQEDREKIVSLYLESFSDSSFTHFKEILEEDYQISVSVSSIANILKHEALIVSPQANKSTVIKYTRQLNKVKTLEKKNSVEISKLERAKYLLEQNASGARKPRKQKMGELIQMDASSFCWVSGQPKWHLHVAIDDSTSEIVGAYFDFQETLHGYYMVLKQILTNYGIPLVFRTDRRTCFEFKMRTDTPVSYGGRTRKRQQAENLENEDPALTQFRMALDKLGIELYANSDPLFKSRVERLNHTLQTRLPVDLKRANVTTIEEANAFLPSYIKNLNDKFSLKTDKDLSNSVFIPGPEESEMNVILSIRAPRVVNASVVKCENKLWALYDKNGSRVLFRDKTPCTVVKALDKTMFCEVDGKMYALNELKERLETSTALGEEEDTSHKVLPKKPYIPAANHPWRNWSI